ncbi:SDR family oxidoreductase [Gemmata obscuriglobus]|uniref:SDR family oxidoreductase n=1 Tax=Gemmata obscuriglobus TaxID=114 RepID=UPI0008FBA3A8
MADASEVNDLIAATAATFDRLDVLVNNAGTTHFVPHTDLDALTDHVWQDIFGVNVMGAFYCVRAALPLLKARKGNVVSVTSVAGLTGQGSSIPYCASKAALNCMTQSLAPSRPARGSSTLIATGRLSVSSRAARTRPMPPRASSRATSYPGTAGTSSPSICRRAASGSVNRATVALESGAWGEFGPDTRVADRSSGIVGPREGTPNDSPSGAPVTRHSVARRRRRILRLYQ